MTGWAGAFTRLSGPKSMVSHEQHGLERWTTRRERISILLLNRGLADLVSLPSAAEWSCETNNKQTELSGLKFPKR